MTTNKTLTMTEVEDVITKAFNNGIAVGIKIGESNYQTKTVFAKVDETLARTETPACGCHYNWDDKFQVYCLEHDPGFEDEDYGERAMITTLQRTSFL